MARRMGEANGKEVFFDYREQVNQFSRQMKATLREPHKAREMGIAITRRVSRGTRDP